MPSVSRDRNELADLVGPFWSWSRVSAALGLSSDRRARGEVGGALLGLATTDGQVVYPVWQFHRLPSGRVEVRPGLAAVFHELQGFDPWAVAVLIHTPAPELDGQTPLEAARSGAAPDDLARVAHAVRREWATPAG
ncbi:hypothetical protein [Nocardioides xinjiangensis]|uniref:hypothetical protein n=1 Tax=Nocardioides xinjiangensis TaxID=2817376 RepID=UPI001B30B82D|nr:hypothetical protein [Nocardioides sp. SYSU D00514]